MDNERSEEPGNGRVARLRRGVLRDWRTSGSEAVRERNRLLGALGGVMAFAGTAFLLTEQGLQGLGWPLSEGIESAALLSQGASIVERGPLFALGIVLGSGAAVAVAVWAGARKGEPLQCFLLGFLLPCLLALGTNAGVDAVEGRRLARTDAQNERLWRGDPLPEGNGCAPPERVVWEQTAMPSLSRATPKRATCSSLETGVRSPRSRSEATDRSSVPST